MHVVDAENPPDLPFDFPLVSAVSEEAKNIRPSTEMFVDGVSTMSFVQTMLCNVPEIEPVTDAREPCWLLEPVLGTYLTIRESGRPAKQTSSSIHGVGAIVGGDT
jgi:hypothetical protein